MEVRFNLLKARMLLQKLDDVPDSGLHPLIIQEAETASADARSTRFPLLVFPCLFEERVRRALESDTRRLGLYWRALASAAECQEPNVLSASRVNAESYSWALPGGFFAAALTLLPKLKIAMKRPWSEQTSKA